MKDRSTVLALLSAALILEALLVAHSGILGWLASGPHAADEVWAMFADWRVLLSVALVTIVLWLALHWYRLRGGDPNEETSIGKK